MNSAFAILLAVLSIWDYPSRQHRHEQLSAQFAAAVREGDTETMIETCQKGVKLLPDDPTWEYNLACSLAYRKAPDEALEALERAIDLGFRNADYIGKDRDLQRLKDHPRFQELVEYAREMSTRPMMVGPNACVPATAVAGTSVALGEQNFSWDFDKGLFVASMKLADGPGGNAGDLYMNRDGWHSCLATKDFPGLTIVQLDKDGHGRKLDVGIPNMKFPYPLFGNCSRAKAEKPVWRSLPRVMMTYDAWRMKAFRDLYLSNQFWVIPAHTDCPPTGGLGDIFSSIFPYILVTEGSSYTDQPYLRAALEASRSLPKETKREMVARGLLTPTIMTLIRKSLRNVTNETDYISGRAHPTAFPKGALDITRLKAAASSLKPSAIPPLVGVSVAGMKTEDEPVWPELTYGMPEASAMVLRAKDPVRNFRLIAAGAEEYAFSVVRGETAAKLTKVKDRVYDLRIEKSAMSVTGRVDVAVFGRNDGTGWGAPSYVSFAVADPKAHYSDPFLTPLAPPEAK